MIQLATAPDAVRSFRPAEGEAKGAGQENQRRSSHAWPFISRLAHKPGQQAAPRAHSADSGS